MIGLSQEVIYLTAGRLGKTKEKFKLLAFGFTALNSDLRLRC
jgi:hypothetical protein